MMGYLWRTGTPVKVYVDQTGRPKRVVWQGKEHTVEQVTRSWLIDDKWWVARIWRVYYLITTDTGLLMVIFRNLITNDWFVHRIHD
jgi:hypothetical protein